MLSNAGMANRQACWLARSASLSPQLELWLGLACLRVIQRSHQVESTSRTDNRSWPSRRKKLCPAAWPRSLVDRALHYTGHRARFPVALSPETTLVSAATTHQGPPASGRASSGKPPLHSRRCSSTSCSQLTAKLLRMRRLQTSQPSGCQATSSFSSQHTCYWATSASHHSELHHYSLLIPYQAQPAVQPFYAQ